MSKTDVSFCNVCDELILWIECPTGGWWKHIDHPEDNHDAEAPPPTLCNGCEVTTATHTLTIDDSVSVDRLTFTCWPCLVGALENWHEEDDSDIQSWVVERL